MTLLGKIFKKEKETIKKEKEVKKAPEIVASQVKAEIKKEGKIIVGVLRMPHITEKSAMLGGENKYIFLVGPRANKIEVKKAVEGRYGVSVRNVNILNMPGKERKRGRQIGWKPGFKKAIVKIKEGQTIEIQ